MRVRPNKRFVFDVARFVKDVRHAAVELNTTPNKICIECDIDPSTFTQLSGRQTSPLADTVLSLCSHVGLNPMNYLVDTDARGVRPSDTSRDTCVHNSMEGTCPTCRRQFKQIEAMKNTSGVDSTRAVFDTGPLRHVAHNIEAGFTESFGLTEVRIIRAAAEFIEHACGVKGGGDA